jgi:TRAP-type C4-dicarboxylate transport system permease large subunit
MMKAIYRSAAVFLVIWTAKLFAESLRRQAASEQLNSRIDEMSLESFPSSDPPSSWAGQG